MSATRPIHVDRLRSLFPESDILTERLLGLPKSNIACRSPNIRAPLLPRRIPEPRIGGILIGKDKQLMRVGIEARSQIEQPVAITYLCKARRNRHRFCTILPTK